MQSEFMVIIALPVVNGSADYLEWLRSNTEGGDHEQ